MLTVVVPALLAYLALGISLWQVTKDVRWEAIYVLTIAVIALGIAFWHMRERASLDAAQYAALRDAPLADRLDEAMEGMISLALYLHKEPVHDTQHHYSEVVEEYVIHGQDATYNWNLRGRNLGPADSDGLVVKFGGDSPLGPDVADIDAMRSDSGTRLRTTVISEEPFIKVFHVLFDTLVAVGQAFHVRISVRWPGGFPGTRTDDYAFFVFGQYAAEPVDRLIGRLISDVPVTDLHLFSLEDGVMKMSAHQPRVVDSRDGHHEVEWSAASVDRLFILRFRKHPPSRHA